jgi:hypothetical protein
MRWRADGKELFYIASDGRLMAVPITLGRGDDPEAGEPVPLFPTRVGGAIQGTQGQQYSVDADGQRFLLDTLSEAGPAITWMMNWSPNR